MLNCPHCDADLAKLDVFPENCPECGRSLMTSGDANARLQISSDQKEPAAEQLDATVESADSSLLPEAPPPATEADIDNPHLSKTLISDEWDNPSLGQTVQSGEIADSGD